jgi:hypothetical protein
MKSTQNIVSDLVPGINAGISDQLGLPPLTDMSRNNFCHEQTLALYNNLHTRGLESRRELHQNNQGWHFIIAHAATNSEPSDSDIMTDMNPWQYAGTQAGSGHLHLPRHELMTVLANAGAPEYFVSLRGLATVTQAHTMRMNPYIGSEVR